MIIPAIDIPSIVDLSLHPKPLHYRCVEYTAMGAAWLNRLGFNPVLSVNMSSNLLTIIDGIRMDNYWGHTVCEVPNLGTYDFFNNIFFPDYYWHKRPVNDNDLTKITQAVEWTDIQDLSVIDEYFKYDPEYIDTTSAWTITNINNIT